MIHQVQRGAIWRNTWRLAYGNLRGTNLWLILVGGGRIVTQLKASTGDISIDHSASTATASLDTGKLPAGSYEAHLHLWLADGTRTSEPPVTLVVS